GRRCAPDHRRAPYQREAGREAGFDRYAQELTCSFPVVPAVPGPREQWDTQTVVNITFPRIVPLSQCPNVFSFSKSKTGRNARFVILPVVASAVKSFIRETLVFGRRDLEI